MAKKISQSKRGASILILSFVFMGILLLLAATLFKIVPADMHSARRAHEDVTGQYVARSGIQDAMSWLNFRIQTFQNTQQEVDLPDYTTDSGATFPNIDGYLTTANAKRPFSNDDWRYEIEIIPQQDTMSLTNNLQPRLYSIRATAFLRDKPIQMIDVLLRQNTFASFAFYTETWDPNSKFLLTGDSSFFGPVHTNDFFNFDATAIEGSGWTGNDPYFMDIVTHSSTDPSAPGYGDGNRWTGGEPYNSSGPITGRYEEIFDGGRNDLRLKNEIQLPSSTASVLDDTWPDAASRPTSDGAYVSTDPVTGKVNGGLLVMGNANEVALRLDEFGNQKMVIAQPIDAGTTTYQKWKWVSYSPPQYYTCNTSPCLEYASGGGAGGAGGGNPPCIKWTQGTCESKQKVPNGTGTTTDYDPFETHIYEVVEEPVTVQDENGNDVTAQVGDTLIVRQQRDDEGANTWDVQSVEVLDGQINGNIYVDGRVGREDKNAESWSQDMRTAGLWGISKGSAVTDANGDFVLDSSGNKTFNNKAIVTPLEKDPSSNGHDGNSISIGGDILQFDPVRFAANKGTIDFSAQNSSTKVRNWATHAALDPQASGGPEKSPNNNHVLGIITLDLWMNGPKNANNNFRKERTGGDGVNDVYAVALAGKTELDSNGDPVGTSGGFGTWFQRRNGIGDGLGEYQIVGGVIQGTESENFGDNSNHTHHWVDSSGTVGYEVNMTYDVEATRQRIFPVQSGFSVIRMLVRSARGR